jgi:hypothetical protein
MSAVVTEARWRRPMPVDSGGTFAPALGLWDWARGVFVAEGAPLLNEDHHHLRGSNIGFLWTTRRNSRQMRRVVGMAQMPQPPKSKWGLEAIAEQRLEEWFGAVPDFWITLDAEYAAEADDLSFCSLVEHELYHCGQRPDKWGVPAFSADGRPRFGIRGHDAEEFVGIVARYGLGGAAGGVADLVRAAHREPTIGAAAVAGVCGTCLRTVA